MVEWLGHTLASLRSSGSLIAVGGSLGLAHILASAAAAVALVMYASRRGTPARSRLSPETAVVALASVRARYLRGELSREQYQQSLADLTR
ncbi:MAG: SHOCT domain-containing protein [Anaerolineae bacterium]